MGKVKNLRQKFHISKKPDTQESKQKPVPQYTPLPVAPISSNVFAGLNISFDSLNKLKHDTIPEDIEPVPNIIKLSSKEKPVNKKDKIRQRRENLLKKIDAVQQAKNEVKLKLKRQKTPIIGDLHPLKDALPSLDSLLKLKPNPEAIKTGILKIDQQVKRKQNLPNVGTTKLSKKARKEMKKQNLKKLAKEYKQRYNNFQKVLIDESFVKNPREAIAMHIKLTLADQSKSSITPTTSTSIQKHFGEKITPVKNPIRKVLKKNK